MTAKQKDAALFALIILGAAGVRAYGLDWGLPYHFNSDERILFYFTEKLRTAASVSKLLRKETQFFIYPPFLMHLLLAIVKPVFAFRPFSSGDAGATTFYYLAGRTISAAFGVGTVGVLYALGKRAYSSAAGLLAAAFLAFSVLHVRDSHFFTTDVTFTFFVVALLWFAVRIAEGAKMRTYAWAGLAAGFGIVTKQTLLLVLPTLLLAHLMAALRGKALSPAAIWLEVRRWSFWRPLFLFGVVSAAAALAMDPYPLIQPKAFLTQSAQLSAFVKGTEQRNWTFQFTGTTFGYWFSNLLWFGMGPVLEAIGLLGALWALRKRTAADLLLLVFVGVYLGVIGTGHMKFIRYALPLVPVLCLVGARFLAELASGAAGTVLRIGARVAIAATLAVSIGWTLAYLNVYRQEDVRVQASRWIHENVPPGAVVVTDNSFTTPLLGSFFTAPDFFTRYFRCISKDFCDVDDRYRIRELNLLSYTSTSLTPPEKCEEYLAERLNGAEYVIMGDEFFEQYRHREATYPALVRFYRELLAGRRGFQLVRTWETRPSLFGLAVNDGRSELTFRLFDHPRVWVFKRSGGTS